MFRTKFAFDSFGDLRPNSKMELITEVDVLPIPRMRSYFELISTPIVPAICLFLVQFLLLTHRVYNIFVPLARALYCLSIDSV
jgi:hypothetical protein